MKYRPAERIHDHVNGIGSVPGRECRQNDLDGNGEKNEGRHDFRNGKAELLPQKKAEPRQRRREDHGQAHEIIGIGMNHWQKNAAVLQRLIDQKDQEGSKKYQVGQCALHAAVTARNPMTKMRKPM